MLANISANTIGIEKKEVAEKFCHTADFIQCSDGIKENLLNRKIKYMYSTLISITLKAH